MNGNREPGLSRRTLLVGALGLGSAAALRVDAAGPGEDWPQWRGPTRDGVWKETGLIEKFAGAELPLRWRAPISGGYSGPTVADGRVFVTDRVLDPKEQERTHCFDWQTGKALWAHTYDVSYRGVGYDVGPRACVTVHDGRAYAFGAVGHFHCYEAATGKVLWGHDLGRQYPIRLLDEPRPFWGISGAPLIEKDLVIVHLGGKPDACLVAFDRKTGAERWRALQDRGSYSAPVLVEQAGKRVLLCWTGDNVVGLDPQTGKTHWAQPFPARQVVIAIATPVVRKNLVFLTSFYEGSLMLRLGQDRLTAERVWERRGQNERSTDALHSIISTPFMTTEGGKDYVYGVDSYGELRCLDALTGNRLWEDQTATPRDRWSTIHFVPNGNRVWMFNERGQLLITRVSSRGFQELSRAQLLRPTMGQLPQRGGVCWSHPAFAYRHVFARNDNELVCASLAG